MIIGNKEIFAFEMLAQQNKKRGPLRLWMHGMLIGNFKKKSELIHGISFLKMILDFENELFEEGFRNMSDRAIFNKVTLSDIDVETVPNAWELFKRYEKHIFFLGDHFDNYSMAIINDNGCAKIFVNEYKKEKFSTYSFKFEYLKNVFSDYIIWYESLFGKSGYIPRNLR